MMNILTFSVLFAFCVGARFICEQHLTHLKPLSEAVGTQFFRIFRNPPERYTNTTYISDVIEGRELEKSRLYPTDNTQILVVYLFFRVRVLLIISRERCRRPTSAKRE